MLHRMLAIAALAAALGCADRVPVTAPPDGGPTASLAAVSKRPEALAKIVAKGLRNAAFRAYLKAQLDASPYREHKLQFQTFLAANGGRALREIASENEGITGESIAEQAKTAIALEIYFPVPEHRAGWGGDENVLVATALTDADAPVAYDVGGRRQVLDARTPPATPVLAVVPVETDFSRVPDRVIECIVECGGDGTGDVLPPPPPAPGLYMTKSHFVQDFEGWLKGSPEFEVHILGQRGQSDSLVDYQCAGEHAGGPYTFDQNNLDWSGKVLLFSKAQLDQYNAGHPSQNVRVFVVEDDDTACEIKTDPNRFQTLITVVDNNYNGLTSGNDSSWFIPKYWGRAQSAYSIFKALASFIRTNDELVGNAVEDKAVGTYYSGFNWIVKGDNNITNGWINLVIN